MEQFTNETVTALLYDGAPSNEVSGEFSLPDYLPDVRRILRVTAEPRVTGRYMNGERMELEGNVDVTLLYASEENTVHSYVGTIPFSHNISIPHQDETTVITAHLTAEHPSCRLSGPRKCTLRCRVRAAVRALTEVSVAPDTSMLPAEETLCTQSVTRPACRMLSASRDDLRYAEDIPTDAPLNEVLLCTVTPCIVECRAASDRIIVKGDFCIRAFCAFSESTDDRITYRPLERRIPFSEELTCEGLPEDLTQLRIQPDLTVTAVTPTITAEGRNLGVDFSAECAVLCMYEAPISVLTDAFLPSADVRMEREEVPFCLPLSHTVLSHTVTGKIKHDPGDDIRDIIDCTAAPHVDRMVWESGQLQLTGTLDVCIIARTAAGTLLPINDTLPITRSIDIPECSNLPQSELLCSVSPLVGNLSVHPDSDKETYTVEATVQMTLDVVRRIVCSLPRTITVPQDTPVIAPSPYAAVLYYPTPGESVWEIAHRYRMMPAHICESNGLPETTASIPDGVRVLLIPTSDIFA